MSNRVLYKDSKKQKKNLVLLVLTTKLVVSCKMWSLQYRLGTVSELGILQSKVNLA